MRARRVAAMLAAIFMLVFPSLAAAAVVESFKAADWDGLAFTNDTTGQFSHCAVYATYQNGSTLYITAEVPGSWFMSIANTKWKLAPNTPYNIAIRVDSNPPLSGSSNAIAPTQLGMPIPAGHPFIEQLRHGKQMYLAFAGAEYAFELTNSSKALNAARDCVAKHLRLGTHTTPALVGAKGQPQQTALPPSPPVDHNRPSAATGPRQQFGPWLVTATTSPNGDFVNCTAFGVYGDNQLILSLFPDNVWTFGFYRPDWKLNPQETYYLWYNIDGPATGAGQIKRPVQAAEPQRLFFEVSDVEDIIQRMARGTNLNIEVRGLASPPEDYTFPLVQTPEALAATQQCVMNRPAPASAAAAPAAPAAASAPASADATPTDPLPPLGDKVLEGLSVPGWKGAAYALDDGSFTHCSIEASYENGATLSVARATNGDLVLGIRQKDWTLKPGDPIAVGYSFTGSSPSSATAQGKVIDPKRVAAQIAGDDAGTAALRAAPQVNVQTAGSTLAFDTSDIGPGIDAIDACVAKHAAPPSKAN